MYQVQALSHGEERLGTPKLSHSGHANQGIVRMTRQMTDHSYPGGGSLCPGTLLPRLLGRRITQNSNLGRGSDYCSGYINKHNDLSRL